MQCKSFLSLEHAGLYTGKKNSEPKKDQKKKVVIDMVDGLSSSYDTMADKFFTSLTAAKELLQQQKTITSIVKLNQKEVPEEFCQNRKCVVQSSDDAYSKKTMLVSYLPKHNKTGSSYQPRILV